MLRTRPTLAIGLFAAVAFGGCNLLPFQPTESASQGCDGQYYPNRERSPYVLPFPVGESYRMNLGNCSSSYHGPGQPDRYAYDFGMPIGTPITAIRAGRVVHVVESGVNPGETNNLVVVRHEDDTFAQYMHLVFDGADVEVGTDVQQGDAIGRSGVTGLAGYPHLHLIVTSDTWRYPYENPTPVSFRNARPRDTILKAGRTYKAGSY